MNLNQLRVFTAIVQEGSLTRAAQSLQISQPAVSKQLSELEADLGAVLFDRLPRGVRVTQAGGVLEEHARRILASERAAEAQIAELSGLGRGSLAVGASTTIGSYLIPNLFGAFKRQHPALSLSLEIANTAVIQAAVLEGRLDLGLTEGFVSSDALDVEVVANDEMVVIAAPRHPLLSRTDVTARELSAEPMMMRERGSGTRDVIEAALRRRGIVIEPTLSLGSTEALKNAVASGLGLAIVSRLSVQLELAVGRLAEVTVEDLQIRRSLHLLRLKHKGLNPAMAAFVALLRESPAPSPTPTYGRGI